MFTLKFNKKFDDIFVKHIIYYFTVLEQNTKENFSEYTPTCMGCITSNVI